tara:strand:+ start:842 stop:1234 length:393 start_codon:yes stop_codon:yes gene_type:complete
MKITKRRLKRIIREEYTRLKESIAPAHEAATNIGDEFAYKLTELIFHGQAKSAKQAYELAELLGAVEPNSWHERPSEHALGTHVEFVITAPDLAAHLNQKANQLGGAWMRDYLFNIRTMRGKTYLSMDVD